MYQLNNLARQIEKQLPARLVEFMQEAGLVAAAQGQNLYLVGGVVRDLLLGRANLDLDLAVTGNAINLAWRLAGTIPAAKLTPNRHFFTAKLSWENWSVDLATTRSETYARPGALPRVLSASIEEDLFRRDFTINAMAVELIPGRWGEVIDLYGGRDDLEKGLIRILHEDSFIDDATRIWRGLRYEQRLDFKLEPKTLRLLKRDLPMLETISGDRIRHELELALKEELPEKVIRRAANLKVLPEVHPGLKGDDWLARKFEEARQASAPNPPSVELYLALLAYWLTEDQTGKLISYLRLRKSHARTLEESGLLKAELKALAEPALAPSRIYLLLHEYGLPAVTANYLATDSPTIKKHIGLFLTKLRNVKPSLTGRDLAKLGTAPGPQMKEVLRHLLEARLDGKVTSKKGEVEMVEGWKDSIMKSPIFLSLDGRGIKR
ncbi:MAG: CCA tRNA nucleotidyltransferase [Chloroflexi bacterium]|nr:CCA tRNA nucleotidyltransferase [Chloroflexota bacterium]